MSRPVGSKEQIKRNDKKASQYEEIVDKVEGLSNPYEDMDMLTKKKHAIYHFYSELEAGFSICEY